MNNDFEKLEREIDRGISALDVLRPEDKRLFDEAAPRIRAAMITENGRVRGKRALRLWIPLFGAVAASAALFAFFPQVQKLLFLDTLPTHPQHGHSTDVAADEVEDVAAALSGASDSIVSIFSQEALTGSDEESSNLSDLQDLYRSLSDSTGDGA